MTEGNIDKFRFHVVDDQNRARSSSWFISSRGDDVYVAPRSTGSALKLSIHRDGNCQYGTTSGYVRRARSLGMSQFPPLVRWKRPETPETGGIAVASILFPTNFLRRVDVPLKGGRKFAIPMAAPGWASEVMLVYSKGSPSVNALGLLARGITPMVYLDLPSGEKVSVGARRVQFDPRFIPDLGNQSGTTIPLTGAPKAGERLNAVHAILYLKQPADGEGIHLVEVNGLSVSAR